MNDPETLRCILAWGENNNLTPNKGEISYEGKDNPMLVACQQDFKTCMNILFHHGYRMEESENKNDEKEDDQVKKYLKFQTASNINYLSLELTQHKALQRNVKCAKLTPKEIQSLEEKDPIRKAFALMEKTKDYKEGFQGSSELKSSYVSIFENLERFIEGILTQCKGINEVSTILDHNAEDDDDDELDDAEANWQIALNSGYKGIVSHPNFQQYFWKKLTGDGRINTHIPFEGKIDQLKTTTRIKMMMKRCSWYMKNIPLTLLTFFSCYPVAVFIDLFRNADILFVKPQTLQDRMKKNYNIENQRIDDDLENHNCLDYLRNRMHIPLFRMVPYFLIQVTYLGLLCFSVWNPDDPLEINLKDIPSICAFVSLVTVAIFAVNFLLDDIIDLVATNKERPHYSKSFWKPFSLFTHLLLVIGGIITGISYCFFFNSKEQANLSGNNPVNVGMTMVSFAVGLEVFRTLQWLVCLETTGPIVLCVIQVLKDTTRMMLVYIIIFFAHLVTFHSLYRPFFPETTNYRNTTYTPKLKSFTSGRGLINNLFWRFITATGPEDAMILSQDGKDFSLEFSHLMGLALWGFFQIIAVILLVNLLIAVMNTSYSNLWQNARKESKFSKSYFQVLKPNA